MVKGYLGIDCGTQGLSCVFTDEDLHTLAVGEGDPYHMVPGLPNGHYEQTCSDWQRALKTALQELHKKIHNMEVLAIGISGQMHGEVLLDSNDTPLGPVRVWCDDRNEEEGHELTELFQRKIAKRTTIARFLWTIRNRPNVSKATKRITTPAGWIHLLLTGEHNLGVGDAAGMFPIDQKTMDYDEDCCSKFDEYAAKLGMDINIKNLLPSVKLAGQDAGSLSSMGAALLGLPEKTPVAAGEGDQVAALAGSLIGKSGLVSCSFGTSVCANIVGDHSFRGVSPAVDHFCAADGKSINMIWLRNGTTFFNSVVASYGGFSKVMPELIDAPADCGGVLAFPFMDDEPGLLIPRGHGGILHGLNASNMKAGFIAKAALLSTIFNLKLNCGILKDQGYPMTELVLTGGLAKTPDCAQILADAFQLPVTLLASADEGCSWGAAVLAKYRHNPKGDWANFLESLNSKENKQFFPNEANAVVFESAFDNYSSLLDKYRGNIL